MLRNELNENDRNSIQTGTDKYIKISCLQRLRKYSLVEYILHKGATSGKYWYFL